MRVGLFTDSYLPRTDGIAIAVDTLRAGLTELGHEVYVICPNRPGLRRSKRIIALPSLPSLWYEGYRDSWPFRKKYLKRVQELELDIIHTHTMAQVGIFGLWSAKKLDLPIVTTQHSDYNLIQEYPWLRLPMRLVLAAVAKITGQSADPKSKNVVENLAKIYNEACQVVLVPSLKMKKLTQAVGSKTAIEIIPNGLDFEHISKVSAQFRQSARTELGIGPRQVLIISTSRLVKEKNVELILRSFGKAMNEDDDLVLLVVGGGPLKRALAKRYSSANVNFLGQVAHSSVYRLLAAADVFMNLSLRETQGLTIAEAMAAGKAVIVADAELGDYLVDQRTCLVAKTDADSVAEAITALAEDSKFRSDMAHMAQSAVSDLTIAKQAQKTSDIYRSILS